MKKQLTGVLATLLCLGCFTGCSMDSVTGTFGSIKDKATGIFDPILDKLGLKDKVETDVKGAAGYLYDLYVEKDTAVRADYEVPNTFQYMGYTYTVAWSVDVTSGVVLEKGDTVTKVNVDELLTADLTYVLTATLSDEYGNSAKTDLERVVKAASAMVSAPITSAPVAGTAYKYHVYQSTKQLDLYFAGSMDGFYFKTTEDVEAATDIYVEYKADSTTEFYPYFTDETGVKQYIGVKVSADGAHDNIVYAADPVSVFVWNAELGTITTTIIDKNDANTEFYLGNYNNYTTISASAISNASSAGSNVGHLIGLVDRNSVPAADKLKQTEKEIQVSADYIGSATVELPAMGTTYPDVAITYTVSGEGATLEGNVLTLTAGSAQSTVTLTATLKVGEESKEVVKTFTVTPKAVMPADGSTLTIKEILALTVQGDTTEKYYVEGTVKSVVNTTFGNVYIEDAEGNELYVYGLYNEDGSIKYGEMDSKPGVGSTVKLYSILATYNGKVQLKNACIKEFTAAPEVPDTPDTPADPDLKLQSAAKLTAGDLGVESEKYASEEGSATVDGIGYGFIQIGNYSDGLIRFRTKNGVSGSLWNTTAYASSIRKIVLTHNPEKSTYDGNKYTVSFGKTAECNDKTVEVETSASSGTLTIEVETGYTFFKITHANTYTQYWNSVEVFVEEDTTTKYVLTTINGNPRLDPNAVTTSEVVPGTTLELPTNLTATGKKFLGWIDGEGNAAPAVMPEADLALYANWEVIPYNVTVKYNNGTTYKTLKMGVEDVYSENEADVIIAASGMAWAFENLELPEGYVLKETLPETFELKEYTFTLLKKVTMSVINGNPRLDPNAVTTSEVIEGSAIELTTPTATGKVFKAWIDAEGNAAPTIVPAEDFAVYASWTVTPYTLTIKQEGAEDKVFKFGVEYDFANGIDISVNDLAYVLADNLPADTEAMDYEWSMSIPETFELQNYTFTIVSNAIYYNLTLINGNPMMPGALTESQVVAGTDINLKTLSEAGKNFLGWFSFSYDEEGNEIKTAAPATMPEADLTLRAVWEVIPYTVTINNVDGTTTTLKFGVEDVYADNEADLIISKDFIAGVVSEKLPADTDFADYEWKEPIPETFELQNYTFTVVKYVTLTLINGHPMMPGAITESKVAYGAALELDTLSETGKNFLGWFSFSYDEEGNEIKTAAPATMPEDGLTLKAVWEVIPYTVTINNADGSVYKTLKFGVEDVYAENEADIIIAIASIGWAIEMELPADDANYIYSYAEEIPETFELQNYTFTIVANPNLDETVAHVFSLVQVTNDKVLYLDGGVSGRYLTMTEDLAAAIKIYAEKVNGSYKFYTVVDDVKQYINVYFNDSNKVSVNYAAETDCAYDYNAETNCWYTNISGTDYYLGTYSTFDTVSASKTSYINAENTGVSQFPLEIQATYTLVMMNGNPRLGGTYEESTVIVGSALNLPTLTAEGKNFLGWFSFSYDEEGNEIKTAAPATMPESDLALNAVWEIIPYTLTINGIDGTTTTLKFGVEYDFTNGIELTVSDLAYVLTEYLPADTDTMNYEWSTSVPDTFELTNYEFSVVANAVYYNLTLMNGNPRLGGTYETSEVVAGATLNLPDLTAEGKTFLGWFSFTYDDEGNEIQTAAPETMPEADLALNAVWEVIPYTITITNLDGTTTESTFGVEYDFANGIEIAVTDLAYVLADNLPANTDTVEYAWAEAIPETFELMNYTFTVTATTVLSLPEANALGTAQSSSNYTTEKYYVYGTIVNVANTTYGNMTIADAEGNTFYVYGVYVDGVKYGEATEKPVVGDQVKLLGVVGNYKMAPQMQNADLISYSTPDTLADVYKVAAESFNVKATASVTANTEITVLTAGKTYSDVAISWASDNACAVVSGDKITFTLPAEAVNVTLTAALTLGEVTKTVTLTVAVSAAPVAGESVLSYTFADYAAGTQYAANEEHVLDNNTTVTTTESHFTTQLRLYSSSTHDGFAIIKSAKVIKTLALNAGNKVDTLNVYGSTDGETWTLIEEVAITSTTYTDYTVEMPEGTAYTYLKLDVAGTQQVRIASFALTVKDN